MRIVTVAAIFGCSALGATWMTQKQQALGPSLPCPLQETAVFIANPQMPAATCLRFAQVATFWPLLLRPFLMQTSDVQRTI